MQRQMISQPCSQCRQVSYASKPGVYECPNCQGIVTVAPLAPPPRQQQRKRPKRDMPMSTTGVIPWGSDLGREFLEAKSKHQQSGPGTAFKQFMSKAGFKACKGCELRAGVMDKVGWLGMLAVLGLAGYGIYELVRLVW